MDPDACLADILHTINTRKDDDLDWLGDYDLLCERIEALDKWIAGGGFLPKRWKTINCCKAHKEVK